MRMSLSRGIPTPLESSSPAKLFTIAEGIDANFRVTAFFRRLSAGHNNPSAFHLNRYVTTRAGVNAGYGGVLPKLPYPANGDFRAVKLFADYPLQAPGVGVSVQSSLPGVWYGHVDTGPDDAYRGERPLAGAKGERFVLPTFNPAVGEPELLLHTLDPQMTDYVTLRVIVPSAVTLELRFYDGSYKLGQPAYLAYPIAGNPAIVGDQTSTPGETIDELFFDQHPMRGPGSIRAIVTEGPDDTPVLIYGAIVR